MFSAILGPDDADLDPGVKMVDVPLGSGDSYDVATNVEPLAARYFRFQFDATTGGRILDIAVNGAPAADLSFYMVWRKAGAFKKATFPAGLKEEFNVNEVLDLSQADELVFIVGGRDGGGTFSLTAAIS